MVFLNIKDNSSDATDNFFQTSNIVVSGWIQFCIIITFYAVLTFISNRYLLKEEVLIRSYSDQLTLQSIEALLGIKDRYEWVGYVFTPIILLLKIVFTTICVSICAVLSTIDFKFKTIFRAALLAELVFISAQILYLINISFHLDTLKLETVANYYPLTALSYFGTGNVVQWLRYPLQTINVFELLYMVVIAWLLSKQWKEDFMESLALVVPSYGTGLILWLVFVTFITLQIS